MTRHEIIKRYIEYYVRLAREYRNLSLNALELKDDFENVLNAARYCIEFEVWASLRDLTQSLNQYLLNPAKWDIFIELNQSLLQSGFLSTDETVGTASELASIELKKGNHDAADVWYERILLLGEAHGECTNIVLKALRRRSGISKMKGELDLSIAYLVRGLQITRDSDLSVERTDLLFELAVVHKEHNSFDLALEYCRRALILAEAISYYPRIIDTLMLQGDLHWLDHRLREARDSYEAALSRAMAKKNNSDVAATRERLRKIAHTMKRGTFISYNHNDRAFAERLATDLRARGLAVWWAEWEIKVGDPIIQKVSEGMLESGFLVVVLSPASVSSPFVQREISSALMRQLSVERHITILPLLLADCEIPVLLRDIRWADFRQDYDLGLRDLLSVLTADRWSD